MSDTSATTIPGETGAFEQFLAFAILFVAVLAFLAFVLLALLWALYAVKSLIGIDLFSGYHLGDHIELLRYARVN
ncbi:hypothetical protein [Actibacterium pelagium]|nr:hypothetical protein [Actibacterium pelagium]